MEQEKIALRFLFIGGWGRTLNIDAFIKKDYTLSAVTYANKNFILIEKITSQIVQEVSAVTIAH